MNIDIANRLYEYRKKNNLSQEELAEKIGVSRQAVSKWERAEASPDTDNLLLLARLYGVSLDELLYTDEPVSKEDKADDSTTKVHIGKGGIHVDDGNDHVHIGWDGIHIDTDEENVHIGGKDGVKIEVADDKEDWENEKANKSAWYMIPVPIIVGIAYVLMGILWNMWHPWWIIFMAVPIYYCIVDMFKKPSWRRFWKKLPVALFTVTAYLLMGFLGNLWHPGWAVFLIIPLYYCIVDAVFPKRKKVRVKVNDDGVKVNADEDDE